MAEVNRQKQLTMITDKEKELNDRYKRQDVDAGLAKRTPYILKDFAGKKIDRTESITLPKAAIFANRANALLSSASPQTIVEGEKMDDKATSKIEEFSEDVYLSIDEYLNGRGEIDLFPFQAQHANLRGGISARIYLRKEEDKLIPDVVPWDTRYVSADEGWASLLTYKSKEMIEREVWGAEAVGKISGKKAKVRDLWTPDEEVIFIDEKFATALDNPWGYVPVVTQLSPAGLQFQDQDKLKYSGESIFWLDRDLYVWSNKCASILATMNMEALHPPYQRVVGDVDTEKSADYPGDARSVTDTIAKLELVPKRDLMNSTRTFWAIIDSHIQQGSFSTIEFGTLQFPLSAVALEDLAEGRHLVLTPGLQTLAMFYRAATRMIIKQFIALKESASFGASGRERKYQPKDFEGDYSITYKYFQSSKRDKLARLSEAQASLPLPVSDDYRRREILELENPDGEAIKVRAEQAEKLDPILLLLHQVHSLIDEEQQVEAQLVFRKLKRLLRGQDILPQPAPTAPPAKGGPQIPLLGKETGGGGGGARRKAEEVGGEGELKEAEREVAA